MPRVRRDPPPGELLCGGQGAGALPPHPRQRQGALDRPRKRTGTALPPALRFSRNSLRAPVGPGGPSWAVATGVPGCGGVVCPAGLCRSSWVGGGSRCALVRCCVGVSQRLQLESLMPSQVRYPRRKSSSRLRSASSSVSMRCRASMAKERTARLLSLRSGSRTARRG